MSRAVVIFARSPEAEAASKRLPIGSAAPLFRAVIARWLRDAREADATAVIACSREEQARFERIAPEVPRLYVEQSGRTFGERLAAAASEAFTLGFDAVLLGGIDAPPPFDVAGVFEQVELGHTVVGAARDGGINVIGLRGPEPALLSGIAPRRRDVLARCRAHFQSLIVLAPSTDIDSLDDVRRARAEASWRDYALLLDAFAAQFSDCAPYVAACSSLRVDGTRAPPAA